MRNAGMTSNIHLEAYVSKHNFPNFGILGSACSPGLGLLGFPRIGSASLALPAPRNNSPAAFGGRAARSAAAVVAGAGKASEADARRGEPSKPRPGEYNDLRQTTTKYNELRRKLYVKCT